MPGIMILQIWDVQHGARAMLAHESEYGVQGRLAMIDSGDNGTTGWKPSTYIKNHLRRYVLDYLFITNADLDHMSDLNNLWREGIAVSSFYRNRSVSPGALRIIKEASGELTDDIERYLTLHNDYVHPLDAPFDQSMGGITATTFFNPYPRFYDTNNLSLVVFFKFGPSKMLFPGDLEEDGWQALLEQPAFRAELANTTVLVASHHGRANSYCQRIFDYFTPQAISFPTSPSSIRRRSRSISTQRPIVACWCPTPIGAGAASPRARTAGFCSRCRRTATTRSPRSTTDERHQGLQQQDAEGPEPCLAGGDARSRCPCAPGYRLPYRDR